MHTYRIMLMIWKKKAWKGKPEFYAYTVFKYTQEDFDEKYRVLKKGCFLVEFMPEENGKILWITYQMKNGERSRTWILCKSRLKKRKFRRYYGRKSKNTEEIAFFTKGKARNLRPDAKKDKAELRNIPLYVRPGGMLPTTHWTSWENPCIHQAEKPVELLQQILGFVTEEKEVGTGSVCRSASLGKQHFPVNGMHLHWN